MVRLGIALRMSHHWRHNPTLSQSIMLALVLCPRTMKMHSIEQESDSLANNGMLERAHEPTEWASPTLITHEKLLPGEINTESGALDVWLQIRLADFWPAWVHAGTKGDHRCCIETERAIINDVLRGNWCRCRFLTFLNAVSKQQTRAKIAMVALMHAEQPLLSCWSILNPCEAA